MRFPSKLLLAVFLTASAAFGEITCIATLSPINEDYPTVPSTELLRPRNSVVRVFSDGIHIATYNLLPNLIGNGYVMIIKNGDPYTDDIITNPSGYYPADTADRIIDSICPGGVTAGQTGGVPIAQASRQAATSAPTGQAADRFLIADFNNDGYPDTAAVASGYVQVTLYGAGHKTLSTQRYNYPTGFGSVLVAADFNGDGILDLAATVVTSAPPAFVAVFLGKGDGTFANAVMYPAGPNPSTLVAADFNGDGKPDLAIASQNATGFPTGTVAVLLGRGDGTFAPMVSYPLGLYPVSMIAVDLNGDGRSDLAILDCHFGVINDLLTVMVANSDGTFRTPTTGVSTGTLFGVLAYTDLNHDGKTDLLIADEQGSSLTVMLGNGDTTFQPPIAYLSAAQPNSVGVIPLADGNTALLTGDAATGLVVMSFANSAGRIRSPVIQTVGTKPANILTADLNRDGKPDIVIIDKTGNFVNVILNSGHGKFANPVSYAVTGTPIAGAIADLNGDGNPDIVVTTTSGVEVLLGKDDGTFSASQVTAIAGAAFSGLQGLAVGDFNGDGKPDVAVVIVTTGEVAILLGSGTGGFTQVAGPTLPAAQQPFGLASVDLNGDGKSDLIAGYNVTTPGGTAGLSGRIAVMLGKGAGAFQAASTITLSTVMWTLSVGDVNKDGRPDLIVGVLGANGFAINIFRQNSDGTFHDSLVIDTVTAVASFTLTDLNGDGNVDLVVGDCCGLTEASYMLGNGDGTFQPEVLFPSGPSPGQIAAADFDGDGKPDFAIAGFANGHGTLVLMKNMFSSVGTATVLSSANGNATAIAPGSLASAFGSNLATSVAGSTGVPRPPAYGGTFVSILDSKGVTTAAPLVYVAPTQVNFLVPATIATGAAVVAITSGDGSKSVANVQIAAVAPGVFTLNGTGLAAAVVLRVAADETQTSQQVYSVNSGGAIVANPIDLGAATDTVYLVLFGTGFQAAGTGGVTVSVGGVNLPVLYAGPQGFYDGLDQTNFVLPRSLAGKGQVTIQLAANGITANATNVTIR